MKRGMEEKSVDLSILFKTSKYRNKHGSSKWSDYIYLIIKMNKKTTNRAIQIEIESRNEKKGETLWWRNKLLF